MKKRSVILTYMFLSVLLILSAVLMGVQAKHYLQARKVDPLEEFKKNEVNKVEMENQLEREEMEDRRNTVMVFNRTNSFRALATPIPKPTPTPVPPPSPTPITPAKNWKINFAAGQMVSLKGYDGKDRMARVGDVIKDSVFGDFKIVAVEGERFGNKIVKVQHVESGVIGYIQEHVKK